MNLDPNYALEKQKTANLLGNKYLLKCKALEMVKFTSALTY